MNRLHRAIPSTLLFAALAGSAAAADTGLDPFVMTDLVSERLLLEVDWVEGCRPTPKALEAAETLLRDHAVEGRKIEIVEDDEIARSEWSAHRSRGGLEELTARHLDADPSDWDRVEVVYVLYVPDGGSWYDAGLSGVTDRVTFSRSGRIVTVRTVLLFSDEIRRDAMLWVTAGKVETATLNHELGHVLGLVGNARHEQSKHPRHCTVARCVMHRAGARAKWVNGLPALFAGWIPRQFCRRCTDDLAAARRVWAEEAQASGEFVRTLRSVRLMREKQDAERWRVSHNPP